MVVIRQNVIALMNKRRLSQSELARRARLTPQCVSYVVTGQRLPNIVTVIKLANALDVSPCALLEKT